jgi:tetratricopeptide (TPR) repeat protein/transcriptional regulator with XRE-family HTH domain
MSQEQLAAATGTAVRTIRNIETGRTTRPRPSTVRLLADAFELHGPERDRFHRYALLDSGGDPDQRGAAGVVPRQLPAATGQFVGRAPELEVLDQLAASGPSATTVPIAAIAGTAGIGKTALAIRWAHQVADKFPDGQLYVNLRGFQPTGTPMHPAEAVRSLLDALAVPPQQIPPHLDAQAGLYRSLLARRRMLIVLDNARDADQVRPLLPASPTCLALVTSRDQLTSLTALEAAHQITLDLLSVAEAQQLLTERLGADRVAAEPHAAEQIISYCARLPLALAIVAARAAAHPSFPLASIANELAEARTGLDALAGKEPTIDLRAVFSCSYHTLSPDAARLFRLLGLHPGPDISAPGAASLAGLPPPEMRPLLGGLTRAHLLTEPAPGRYRFHDLLRAYATELAERHDADHDRHAATVRTLDHYLHTAHRAARLLNPTGDQIAADPPRPGTTPEPLADYAQALAWLTTEHPVLVAAVDHSSRTGLDTHTWQLAWTLVSFLSRLGHWQDYATTQSAAVAAARRLGDPTTQARTHRYLGQAYSRLGRFDDAHTQFRSSLDLATRAGDRIRQADAHLNLGGNRERQGRYAEALDHARQALDLHQSAGHQVGQADALNAVGWCHARLGDYRQALTYCQQALGLHQASGNRNGQAGTWDSLGYAHHHLGQHTQAITCYQRAIQLLHDLADRPREASTLTRLGDTQHTAGNPHAARTAWQHALSILTDLDHPDTLIVQTRLQQVPVREADGPPHT